MKRIDADLNMYRFYKVEITKDLFNDYGVNCLWGRVAQKDAIALIGMIALVLPKMRPVN